MPEVSKPQVPYFGTASSEAASALAAAALACALPAVAAGAWEAASDRAAMAAAESRWFLKNGLIRPDPLEYPEKGDISAPRRHQKGNSEPSASWACALGLRPVAAGYWSEGSRRS